MYYNNDMELSRKLLKLEIKNRKYLISLYDSVLECLKKFDGKQVTKRIETALKKIDDNIHMKNDGNSFVIELYFKDRSISHNNGYYYLKNSDENFCYCSRFSSYGDGVINVDNTNSLNYAILEKEMLKHKDYLIQSIEKSEKQLKDIDSLIEEYKDLQEKCNDFNNKIHWSIAEYYNIKRFELRS